MNTSEKYIKMCVKSLNIQQLWKPKDGDHAWHPNEGAEYLGQYEFPEELAIVKITEQKPVDWWRNWIWLLLQDELQEIMSKYIQEQLGIVHSEIKQAFLDFSHWLSLQYRDESFVCVPTNCFETGEQLWLAYMMQEKYNKVWNNKKEDWEKRK